MKDYKQFINEDNKMKDQIKFFRSVKTGDTVVFNGKPQRGFEKGKEYEVYTILSNSTFEKTIILKNGKLKARVTATNSIKPINDSNSK